MTLTDFIASANPSDRPVVVCADSHESQQLLEGLEPDLRAQRGRFAIVHAAAGVWTLMGQQGPFAATPMGVHKMDSEMWAEVRTRMAQRGDPIGPQGLGLPIVDVP